MYKKLIALMGSIGLLLSVATSANAEGWTAGVSGMVGFVSTDGSESEKTGAGAKETHNHSTGELFAGGSLFAEYEFSNGLAFGVDMVPADAELGSGSRIDSGGTAENKGDDGNSAGTFTASADLTDLYTLYVKKTLGQSGLYALLGYHDATITTTESLPTSTYGDASVNGTQVGIGYQATDNMRFQLTYSDFDSIELKSTNDATQKIKADADAIYLKIGLHF